MSVNKLYIVVAVILAIPAGVFGYPMAKAYFDCTAGAQNAARAMAKGEPVNLQHECSDALAIGEAFRRATQ